MNDQEYSVIKNNILTLTGIDLDSYKTQQMHRRLSFYLETNKVNDIYSYCAKLKSDAEYLKKLRDFITINVTEFFRDHWAFDELQKKILTALLARKNKLKIWSAGCSNGGEPYSIAMLLLELTGTTNHNILATDVDDYSILTAIAGGPYIKDTVKCIPPDYLGKYLTVKDDRYWVNQDIRKIVKFQQHNMLSDAYQTDFDLICCRNVTIYFTKEAQSKLYRNFNNSLNFGGVLFIGATEFFPSPSEYGFLKLGTCFYQKTSTPVPSTPHLKEVTLERIAGGV